MKTGIYTRQPPTDPKLFKYYQPYMVWFKGRIVLFAYTAKVAEEKLDKLLMEESREW